VLVISTLPVIPEKYNPRYFTLFSQGIGKLFMVIELPEKKHFKEK